MDLNTYRCTLTPGMEEKAVNELNENPQDRVNAIRALYEWILDQPHLSCPDMDTSFLLTFLRGAKWSQLRAREKVEGYLRMKNQVPEWLADLDPTDPKVQAVLDTGFLIKLPKRDKNGCQLLIMRHGQIDTSFKKYSPVDVMRALMVTGACMSGSETTQVCGSIFIVDMTGVTSKHMTYIINKQDIERLGKFLSGGAPGRQKGTYYYNAGAIVDTIMLVVKPFLPKKFQERIKTFDSAESMYKEIPMDLLPEEYLPDDYTGPHAGSISEILKNYKDELASPKLKREMIFRSSNKYNIDDSLRPKEKVTSSFRKLAVD